MSTDRTTEILNYLTAISREVGELRAEVKSNGKAIGELHGQMDELQTEMRELRNDVRAITSRLDRLEARMLENRADVRVWRCLKASRLDRQASITTE